MVFTSSLFLFLFLPFLLLAWHSLATQGPVVLAVLFLCLSLLYQSLCAWYALLLLLALTAMNHAFGLIFSSDKLIASSKKNLLKLALLLNLLPLFYCRYAPYLINLLQEQFNLELKLWLLAEPPGLAFWTLIQIAWLVDVYRKQIQVAPFLQHSLLGFGFPWSFAGPLVRYEQMGQQFNSLHLPTPKDKILGLFLLSVGLGKTLILAESLHQFSGAIFQASIAQLPLSIAEAWLGSFAYSFQIYFQLSGYSDLAIGLALLIGLYLPENFLSPYKATGFVEFWRRWHITLATWLRDFIYIPLGGKQYGRIRQYFNLFLVMLICGLWHGVGLNFLLWGALHGLCLTLNHYFRLLVKKLHWQEKLALLPVRIFCISLTFLCLNFCWLIFGSENLISAKYLCQAMFGLNQTMQADNLISIPIINDLSAFNNFWLYFCPHNLLPGYEALIILSLSAIIIWAMPNCCELLADFRNNTKSNSLSFTIIGTKGKIWAIILASILVMALFLPANRASWFLG